MADILIRGIEFPQCCGDCPFQASRWTGDFCSAGQFMLDIDFDYRDKHPKCPLATLPEGHGKIGDLDALDKFLHERETEADAKELYFDKAWYRTFRQILRLMQTIVPAEGGTDNGA